VNPSPQLRAPEKISQPGRQWAYVAVVALCAALAFVEASGFGFIYDDIGQIVENPHITSIHSIPEYFTRPVALNFYRPLFMTWLLVNRKLFGLDPMGWHLASIAMHVVASVLVLLVTGRMLRTKVGALMAALVFAVHPTKLEAVAWVSGVTEPMMAAFVLGSLYAFIRGREGSHGWTVASAILAAGAMLSKETGIVVVPLVFLYRYLFAERERLWSALRSALPFAIIGACYLMVRFRVIGEFAHPVAPLDFSSMVLTWPKALVFYLKQLIWPLDLAVYYDLPTVDRGLALGFLLPASMLAVAGGLIGYVFYRTKQKVWLFGWLWLVIALAPVLYFRAFGMNDFVHDRYLYLPSVGLALALTAILEDWRERSVLATPVGVVVIGGFLFATFAQTPIWRNDYLLFSRAYQVSPGSEYVLNNLGLEMEKRGAYDRAVSLYRAAVQKNPKLWTAQYNLGLFLYRTGALSEAEQHLVACLNANPIYPPALANRALLKMHQRDFPLATQLAQRAVELAPGNANYLVTLGSVRAAAGDVAGARQAFTEATRIDPTSAEAKAALQGLPQK
jgi:protein O-mannosyl-transferase